MTDPLNPNTPAASASDGDGENLRDARLARALQHMPDAHMQPSAQLRQAVLQQALRAVAQPEPRTTFRKRWQAWWRASGQSGPWSAALTSVAVVGVIAALWYGQEVPDATPERSPVAQRKADADPANASEVVASRSAALGKTRGDPAAPATATVEVREAGAAARATDLPAQSARVAPTLESGAGASKGADAKAPLSPNSVSSTPSTAATPAASLDPLARQEAARGHSRETMAVAGDARPAPAPAPTAPAALPAPVAAERATAPATALVDAAVAPQRSRADAKAVAPSTPVQPMLLVDGRARPADTEQARNGLALLRGLSYAAATPRSALPSGSMQDREGQDPAQVAISANEGLGGELAARAPLVVEIAGVERWTVTAQQVVYQRLDSGQTSRAAIAPEQYAALLRMAQTPLLPPR